MMRRILLSCALAGSACSLIVADEEPAAIDAGLGPDDPCPAELRPRTVWRSGPLGEAPASNQRMRRLGARRFDIDGTRAALLLPDQRLLRLDLSAPLAPAPLGEPITLDGVTVDAITVAAGRTQGVGRRGSLDAVSFDLAPAETFPRLVTLGRESRAGFISRSGDCVYVGFELGSTYTFTLDPPTDPSELSGFSGDVRIDRDGTGMGDDRLARATLAPPCTVTEGDLVLLSDVLIAAFAEEGLLATASGLRAISLALDADGRELWSLDLRRTVRDATKRGDRYLVAAGRDLLVLTQVPNAPRPAPTATYPLEGEAQAVWTVEVDGRPWALVLAVVDRIESEASYVITAVPYTAECGAP